LAPKGRASAKAFFEERIFLPEKLLPLPAFQKKRFKERLPHTTGIRSYGTSPFGIEAHSSKRETSLAEPLLQEEHAHGHQKLARP
jgi:hypothetical protein